MCENLLKSGELKMLGLKRNIVLSESDFDDSGNIKASSLMQHFQDIAQLHATSVNLGFEDLMKDCRIWVMTKLKFKVYRKMPAGSQYEFSTYPRGKKSVTWFRDYYVYDREGNLFAAAISNWCIINFNTRRIERANVDFNGEFIDHPAIEGGIEKIRIPEDIEYVGTHHVTEEDLDENAHVNNCRYADMIGEITGRNDYNEFIIHFAKESRKGDSIELYKTESEGYVYAEGKLEDGTVIFQAKVR